MSAPQAIRATRTGPAFALLATIQMTLICGITVISVPLPAVQSELGLNQGQLALISSAYGLSFGGLLLLGGRLADLCGPRRLFLSGVILFGVTSAAAAIALDFWPLLFARFAQGIGAAMTAPAAMALVTRLFPEPVKRSRVLATWGALSGIGAILGTLVSGVVAEWVSWRWTFVALVGIAGTVLSLSRRLLPADQLIVRGRIDVPGAILATGGLTTLSYGLLEGAVAAVAIGALLLAAFVLVESRVSAPLIPLSFLVSRSRALALTAIVCASAGMATSLFFLSLHLQQERDLSPLQTSAVFLPYGVVLIATGMVAGRLLHRWGPHVLLVAGLITAAVGLTLIASFEDTLLTAGLVVLALGTGLTFAAATVTVMADVPGEQAGLAGGIANTAMEVGPTAGLAALVTVSSTSSGGYGFALGTAAGAFGIAALAAIALLRPRIRR